MYHISDARIVYNEGEFCRHNIRGPGGEPKCREILAKKLDDTRAKHAYITGKEKKALKLPSAFYCRQNSKDDAKYIAGSF